MILTNCRLVPELCEDIQQEYADIRVEGNTIAEILHTGGSYLGEEVIDCKGKTALPGLFNLHAHLFFDKIPVGEWHRTDYQRTLVHTRFMYEMLCYGFTNVRDCGGPNNIAINLRNDINAGNIIGPNITACGYVLTPTQISPPIEAYSDDFGRACDGPIAVRQAVRTTLKEGADFIKVLGSASTLGIRPDVPIFYPDETAALVEAVELEGTYLAVHTSGPSGVDYALDANAYTIEHGFGWNQNHTDKLVANGMKSTIIPTLTVSTFFGTEEFCFEMYKGVRTAYDAGALLGFGNDATEEMFMAHPGYEFDARARCYGFSNIEVLKQATINSAKILHTDDIRGTIKVGKRADFAIIEGNPDEDLSLLNKPCAYVIKDGMLVASHGMVRYI